MNKKREIGDGRKGEKIDKKKKKVPTRINYVGREGEII